MLTRADINSHRMGLPLLTKPWLLPSKTCFMTRALSILHSLHPLFFFGFIFNFDICRYLFIKIDKRVSTIPQLVPTFLRFSMYQAYNRPSTHVSPHLLLHLLSHPNITNSLLSAFFPSISKMHLSAEISRQLQAFLKRPSLESAIPCQTRLTSTAACSSATASHFATSSLPDSRSQ